MVPSSLGTGTVLNLSTSSSSVLKSLLSDLSPVVGLVKQLRAMWPILPHA